MPTLGLPELVIIVAVLVLVFGASRLPGWGASLGRSLRAMRRELKEDSRIEVTSGSPSPPPSSQSKETRLGAANDGSGDPRAEGPSDDSHR